MTIAENIERVRKRIGEACLQVGRRPEEITLVGVTKGVSEVSVAEAYRAGVHDFGESYWQESLGKIQALRDFSIRWHFIGHLQKNKARLVAASFHVIQSLDGVELGMLLNRIGEQYLRRLQVLLEVNIGLDPNKKGFMPDNLDQALPLFQMPFLQIQGLMSIPPLGKDAKPFFRQLRMLRDSFAEKHGVELPVLSMGMTDDYFEAVLEGATMVRIGRAIFGERRTQLELA